MDSELDCTWIIYSLLPQMISSKEIKMQKVLLFINVLVFKMTVEFKDISMLVTLRHLLWSP
jgi:hypothetical protein